QVPNAASLFDFNAAAETLHVPLTIRGSGFQTANPLIITSTLQAGGMTANVFSSSYHTRSMVYAPGLAHLEASLRQRMFYGYYQKAVSADSLPGYGVPAGMNKPFGLDAVGSDEFAGGVTFTE